MRRSILVTLAGCDRLKVQYPPHIAMQTCHGGLVNLSGPKLGPLVEEFVRGLDSGNALNSLVGLHLDARGVAHSDHNGCPIGLFVIKDRQHPVTRRHRHKRASGRSEFIGLLLTTGLGTIPRVCKFQAL